jgi:D-xylose 1-dehydrogenase (NADP+, D-xylono-1,5-lactone-forming)
MAGLIRWGILSNAGINSSVAPAIHAAEGCELAAIASRTAEGAARAATDHGAARSFSSYDALLADADIDVVYIPLPNDLHAEWAVRALDAGKHVLVEKPLALSTDEVDAVAAAAARNDRLVYEGFMYRHTDRWARLVDIVRSGAIGTPQVVRVDFAFVVAGDTAGGNIRFAAGPGGGIVWDMGCYAVNMARGALGVEPGEAYAVGRARSGVVPETSASGLLSFPEAVASWTVSFDHPSPAAQVEVLGTEGWVSLGGHVLNRTEPMQLLVRPSDATAPEVETFAPQDPYRLEVEHVNAAVRDEVELAWKLDDARANCAVLEAVHTSLREHRPVAVA